MTCETGNCPECIIRVGAMPTPINLGQFAGSDNVQTYHVFIWYHDNGTDYIYRGGPQSNSAYGDLVASGAATEYSGASTESLDIDWPFANLVTNRKVGLDNDYDYMQWVDNGSQARHMVIVAQGPDYCGLDERFTTETRRVGQLGRTYNAWAATRTDNSNATAYTILDEMDLPRTKPAVHAPGWGTNLHTYQTPAEAVGSAVDGAVEDMGAAVDEVVAPVRREMNWFNGLNQLEQYNVLRNIFR